MEKIVKDVYTDISSPYSFGGLNRLYNGLKELGYNISKSKVKNILKSIPSYTLHKQPRKKFKRRPIMVSKPGLFMNCDLLEYSELSKTNKNYRYLLVCQDMFSRYVYTELLKNKKADTVVIAFKNLKKKHIIAILIYNQIKVQNSLTPSLKNYWINMKFTIIIHIIAKQRLVLLNVFCELTKLSYIE